jgi:hypothetical protein
MKLRFRGLALQVIASMAGLSFCSAQTASTWQSLAQMSVKSHYPDQAVFSELSSSRAVSGHLNAPFSLEHAIFRLFRKSFVRPVIEIKLLKAMYSLKKGRLLVQGSAHQPDLMLIVDFRNGTVYEPSRGLATLSEYFQARR